MLQTYAVIDERVSTLGYIMKVFAKVSAFLVVILLLNSSVFFPPCSK